MEREPLSSEVWSAPPHNMEKGAAEGDDIVLEVKDDDALANRVWVQFLLEKQNGLNFLN